MFVTISIVDPLVNRFMVGFQVISLVVIACHGRIDLRCDQVEHCVVLVYCSLLVYDELSCRETFGLLSPSWWYGGPLVVLLLAFIGSVGVGSR